MGDQSRLEQVFINILSNAIKYTKEKGVVSIEIHQIDDRVQIEICDTGIGIPVKDQRRIFERFYRVDKARSREMGGTGLGLAIAKDIVTAHHGEIAVESEVDRGTKITISLPCKPLETEN
jgi:signal transduction histidine kinase